jgi:hypothetical protein
MELNSTAFRASNYGVGRRWDSMVGVIGLGSHACWVEEWIREGDYMIYVIGTVLEYAM